MQAPFIVCSWVSRVGMWRWQRPPTRPVSGLGLQLIPNEPAPGEVGRARGTSCDRLAAAALGGQVVGLGLLGATRCIVDLVLGHPQATRGEQLHVHPVAADLEPDLL